MTRSVTIVIVSFNTADLLEACLRSVLATTRELDVELVVVDNASVDGSADVARRTAPHATVVALPENVGFAAACNLGAARGSAAHILLLNPDAQVRPGCVRALLDCLARHPQAGVVGGRSFNPDGSVSPQSCYGLPSLWSMFCFATGLSTAFARTALLDPESLGRWDRSDERTVGIVTGALLLCSRELWERVGGLPESYFVYGEDVEFSFRVRELGYAPRITPLAQIVHVGGAASASSAAKWQMMLRGKVTFMARCWPAPKAVLGRLLLLSGTRLRAVGARLGLPVRGPWQENWERRAEWRGGWAAADRQSPRS